MSDGGKGSKPRPIPDPKQFEENWDKIFGKKIKINIYGTEIEMTQDELDKMFKKVDKSEYMCPNCLTPWKCNGPHIEEKK